MHVAALHGAGMWNVLGFAGAPLPVGTDLGDIDTSTFHAESTMEHGSLWPARVSHSPVLGRLAGAASVPHFCWWLVPKEAFDRAQWAARRRHRRSRTLTSSSSVSLARTSISCFFQRRSSIGGQVGWPPWLSLLILLLFGCCGRLGLQIDLRRLHAISRKRGGSVLRGRTVSAVERADTRRVWFPAVVSHGVRLAHQFELGSACASELGQRSWRGREDKPPCTGVSHGITTTVTDGCTGAVDRTAKASVEGDVRRLHVSSSRTANNEEILPALVQAIHSCFNLSICVPVLIQSWRTWHLYAHGLSRARFPEAFRWRDVEALLAKRVAYRVYTTSPGAFRGKCSTCPCLAWGASRPGAMNRVWFRGRFSHGAGSETGIKCFDAVPLRAEQAAQWFRSAGTCFQSASSLWVTMPAWRFEGRAEPRTHAWGIATEHDDPKRRLMPDAMQRALGDKAWAASEDIFVLWQCLPLHTGTTSPCLAS